MYSFRLSRRSHHGSLIPCAAIPAVTIGIVVYLVVVMTTHRLSH